MKLRGLFIRKDNREHLPDAAPQGIKRTVYPFEYDKNLMSKTDKVALKKRTRNFNNWALGVRAEIHDSGLVDQANKLLNTF